MRPATDLGAQIAETPRHNFQRASGWEGRHLGHATARLCYTSRGTNPSKAATSLLVRSSHLRLRLSVVPTQRGAPRRKHR